MAEIETDKATMEFEAVDEGVVTKIWSPKAAEGVKVGTVIALIQGEDEDRQPLPSRAPAQARGREQAADRQPPNRLETVTERSPPSRGRRALQCIPAATSSATAAIIASPLAKRIAAEKGIDLCEHERHWPRWTHCEGRFGRLLTNRVLSLSKHVPPASPLLDRLRLACSGVRPPPRSPPRSPISASRLRIANFLGCGKPLPNA